MLEVIKNKMKKSNNNIGGVYHTYIKDKVYIEGNVDFELPKLLKFNDLVITDFKCKKNYYIKEGIKTPNAVISYTIIHKCNIDEIENISDICWTALIDTLGSNEASKNWNQTESEIKDDVEIFMTNYLKEQSCK